MRRPRKWDDLPTLADQIKHEHAAVRLSIQSGLEHARRAGELLVQAKALIAHGGWIEWLAANTGISTRTAQAYMQVTRRYAELTSGDTQRVAHLSLRDGLKLLAEPNELDIQETHLTERAVQDYFKACVALVEIRDRGLYRTQGYLTFEEYCEKRWGISGFDGLVAPFAQLVASEGTAT